MFNIFIGDGVVLERCIYSDFVFTEAMHKMGYLSARGKLQTEIFCMYVICKIYLVKYIFILNKCHRQCQEMPCSLQLGPKNLNEMHLLRV